MQRNPVLQQIHLLQTPWPLHLAEHLQAALAQACAGKVRCLHLSQIRHQLYQTVMGYRVVVQVDLVRNMAAQGLLNKIKQRVILKAAIRQVQAGLSDVLLKLGENSVGILLDSGLARRPAHGIFDLRGQEGLTIATV